jgi:hypothetical protein
MESKQMTKAISSKQQKEMALTSQRSDNFLTTRKLSKNKTKITYIKHHINQPKRQKWYEETFSMFAFLRRSPWGIRCRKHIANRC